MTEMSPATTADPHFQFLRNGEAAPAALDWREGPIAVRKAIGDALNARNIAFLLGAGCSSLKVAGVEKGLSTMQALAAEFCAASLPLSKAGDEDEDDGRRKEGQNEQEKGADAFGDPPTATPASPWILSHDEFAFLTQAGVELKDNEYVRNLERLMEVLHSLRFVLRRSSKPDHQTRAATVESIVAKVQAFLWARCTQGSFANGDNAVRELYESFYRKLVLRDRSLPRPWVFTTNYDLFNETAMDRLVSRRIDYDSLIEGAG
jgi:hypothetical protein